MFKTLVHFSVIFGCIFLYDYIYIYLKNTQFTVKFRQFIMQNIKLMMLSAKDKNKET